MPFNSAPPPVNTTCRPRGLSGLPEAHAGPAFATVAGLVQYAASDPVDLRQIVPSQLTVHRPSASSVVQRLMAAFRQGY
jgi:cell division protein FtsA